jgi:NAD+ synthase (glutamine-hydrolysing)
MEGFYRIAAAAPHLHLGDPAANAKELVRLAKGAAKDGVAAIVFPELCLTGYTCGDMFFRDELLAAANAAAENFAAKTANLPLVSIVGLPVAEGPAIYNAAAVVHGGKIAGIVRKRALPNYGEYYERRQFTPAPADEPLSIFDVGGFRFGVEICEDLWTPVPPSSLMAEGGVDVVFNLSASTDFLGKSLRRQSLVEQQSLRLGCAYAMACAGSGESSSDAVYGGCPVIAVEGRTVAAGKLFSGAPQIVAADVDVAAARHRRRSTSSVYCSHPIPGVRRQLVTLAVQLPAATPSVVSRSPFLDEYGEDRWWRKLLDIQATGLSRRMASAAIGRLVVGVSGGADSALALLGASAALDRLGLERDNLLAVVMPGFGSTKTTQDRAVALAEAVGASVRVVDIRESCRKHLSDIGHVKGVHDIAYENAQARERTQVLMDIANMERALVVGTGDLSEIALGWNTYNGDHMSMYQINASVPKTMVLAALRLLANDLEGALGDLLRRISSAPITPELLPGAVANDSEARLGPYELHDFFLYHYLVDGASAATLRELAEIAFAGEYSRDVVEETLTKFLRRFRTAQYKRNCVPDGPKITLSLSPRADWRMPSDLS